MGSRAFDLLAGTNFVDADFSGGTYFYYSYIRENDGSWIIMRMKQDNTEMRYAVGRKVNYDVKWADRENLEYVRPDYFARG